MKVRLGLGSELGKLRDPTGGPGAYVRGLGSGLWLNKKMKMFLKKELIKRVSETKHHKNFFRKFVLKRCFLIREYF